MQYIICASQQKVRSDNLICCSFQRQGFLSSTRKPRCRAKERVITRPRPTRLTLEKHVDRTNTERHKRAHQGGNFQGSNDIISLHLKHYPVHEIDERPFDPESVALGI